MTPRLLASRSTSCQCVQRHACDMTSSMRIERASSMPLSPELICWMWLLCAREVVSSTVQYSVASRTCTDLRTFRDST